MSLLKKVLLSAQFLQFAFLSALVVFAGSRRRLKAVHCPVRGGAAAFSGGGLKTCERAVLFSLRQPLSPSFSHTKAVVLLLLLYRVLSFLVLSLWGQREQT